ncbi:hypothetical protein LCGC14_1443080 [marine sediment metagenome]|uniref:Uncharacterized protein n=1 Tax=marine sediment metagenome TaxID=412755 RepID=A0A0F9K6A6_9ZZZZ
MNKKQRIEEALFKLKKVVLFKPTALELHQARGVMLSRVQRQEDRRHWEAVQRKKVKLEQQLLDLKSKENQGLPQQESLQNGGPLVLPKKALTRVKSKSRMSMGRYGY